MSLGLLAAAPLARAADIPADGWLVFSSNRADARMEIYVGRAGSSDVKRLTTTGGTYPNWSPDGRWISYQDDVGDAYLVRPDGSERRKLPAPAPDGAPAFWPHDNSGLVIKEPDGGVYLHDPDTMERRLLFKLSDFPNRGPLFHLYSMTHDNRFLFVASDIFTNGFTVTNGTFETGYSAILIDLLDKKKMYMVGPGCWPFTPPEGDVVFHISGHGETWPDVWRMDLADLQTRSSYAPELAHPDPDWGHEYHPRISNDNKWLVYMTSNGCHWDYSCNNEIFLHRLGAGTNQRTRLTNHESFDGFPGLYVGPAWQKTAEPRLFTTPNRLTFFARAGAAPAAQTVKLKNGGGGELGAATVTIDPPVKWLDVSVDRTTLSFGLRQADIARGRFKTTVTVTAAGAAGGPSIIPVTLDADDSFPAATSGPAPEPDAGAPTPRPGSDAGVAPPRKPSGCSIAPGGAGGGGAGLALAALVALLRARRRARTVR